MVAAFVVRGSASFIRTNSFHNEWMAKVLSMPHGVGAPEWDKGMGTR